jgi:UrcA family protein
MMKSLAISAGALLVASAGLAQTSHPPTQVSESRYTERVIYEPSELASEAGIRDLHVRVRHAAQRVCARSHVRLDGGYSEGRCFSATLTDALVQVDEAVVRWARAEQPRAPRILVAAR